MQSKSQDLVDSAFDSLSERLVEAIHATAREAVFENPRVRDELLQGEGLRAFWRYFAVALVTMVEQHDPEYPSFMKPVGPWLNWAYPNPDGTYHMAHIHGDHTYRIWGTRGTAKFFGVQAVEGHVGDTRNMRPLGNLRDVMGGTSEIDLGAGGTFELVLSRKEHPGNWMPIAPGIGHLWVRQWYYDYETEVPGEVFIERLEAPYPRPPVSVDGLAKGFERVIEFLKQHEHFLSDGVGPHFLGDPATVPFPGTIFEGDRGDVAHTGQSYAKGHYECGPEEAVILEVAPPSAEYWMFCLVSLFWESYDWLGRQISINGGQAVLDDDGRFRAVIAHRDPGVPNWLDACGHTTGLIGGRYTLTADVPIPTLTTVPFDRLRDVLPASTPVVTPEERSEVLRRRFISQQRRSVTW